MNDQRYVEFYHIAQDVLVDKLVKHIEDDNEIISEWLSNEGWLMLVLPSECCMNDAKNRMEPNIYVSVIDKFNKKPYSFIFKDSVTKLL